VAKRIETGQAEDRMGVVKRAVAKWPAAWQEDYEERVAIMVHMGDAHPPLAMRRAYDSCLRRMEAAARGERIRAVGAMAGPLAGVKP